jgi:hypothetical protein
MPLRIRPDLGQVPENNAQPSSAQRCHVLHDCVERSNHANGSKHFPPKAGTGAGNSGATASVGNVLAGEAAGDDISLTLLKDPRLDVVGAGHVRPVLCQHGAGGGVDLAEADRAKAGALHA